jgi:hypothetical protein
MSIFSGDEVDGIENAPCAAYSKTTDEGYQPLAPSAADLKFLRRVVHTRVRNFKSAAADS